MELGVALPTFRAARRRPSVPRRVAEDLARLEPVGVEEVFFSNRAADDLDTELGLLGEVRAAVAAGA